MAEVAYTIGHTESYDKYLRDDPKPMKLGAGAAPGYAGGYVWKWPWQAADFLKSDGFASTGRDGTKYGVYQLDLPTGWAVDATERPHTHDGVHRLLRNARIVKRVEIGATP